MEVDIEYTPKGYQHVISPIEKHKTKYTNQPKYAAYWLYRNRIIPVPMLHINVVIEHPDKFDFTEDELREIFDKHNEPYGHEGKARVEIIQTLLAKGWIRVRYTPRNDLWTIELASLSKSTKDSIWSFFTLLTGNDIGSQEAIDTMNQFSDVKITEIRNGEVVAHHKTSVRDVVSFKGLFEGCVSSNPQFALIEDLFINNFEKTILLLQK